MLRKPDGYDSAVPKALGEFQQLPAGAYHCYISSAYAAISKSGKNEMLVLELDIASGEYANMYANSQYKPMYHQVTGGSSLDFFKGMMMAIEQSNTGYKWDWNPNSLINKQCAVAFGEEEYMKDGVIAVSVKPRWIRSLQELREGKVPIPKIQKYKGTNGQSTNTQSSYQQGTPTNGPSYQPNTAHDPFAAISETLDDDELPF